VLRAGVLSGQSRPEGFGAIRCGCCVALVISAGAPSRARRGCSSVARTAPEREFVRVLANMLLQTQSEAMHVY
jgi:hypothetical protein